jgi:hypothetical protein
VACRRVADRLAFRPPPMLQEVHTPLTASTPSAKEKHVMTADARSLCQQFGNTGCAAGLGIGSRHCG